MGGTLHQQVHLLDRPRRPPRRGRRARSPVPPQAHRPRLRESWPDDRRRDRSMVNSLHEQAIDRVADGLEVEAVAEDGTVEAVRVRDADGVRLRRAVPSGVALGHRPAEPRHLRGFRRRLPPLQAERNRRRRCAAPLTVMPGLQPGHLSALPRAGLLASAGAPPKPSWISSATSAGPAGLVRGAEAAAGVAVEKLVEQRPRPRRPGAARLAVPRMAGARRPRSRRNSRTSRSATSAAASASVHIRPEPTGHSTLKSSP